MIPANAKAAGRIPLLTTGGRPGIHAAKSITNSSATMLMGVTIVAIKAAAAAIRRPRGEANHSPAVFV